MPYLGNTPSTSFATVVKDAFSGDGSTVAFTLSKVATTNSVSVFVENVRQEPTTAYAVSGTTLTFTAAPVTSSGNNIYVLHMNPTTTTTHPAAQALTATTGTFTSTVDINGNELILDADADTSITADTDDEIHIKIAGADDFKFKANTLEVQTGSNIDMNGTELILDADADSSITADTDDQIDVKVGGTDTVVIKPDEMILQGPHPSFTLTDSDDTNGGGIFYNNGALSVAADTGNTGATGLINFQIDGNTDVSIDGGGDLTIADGNLVIGTSGHGIDFSANTQSAVSGVSSQAELLSFYEEGDWTPVAYGASTSGSVTSGTLTGKYTRIGRMVHIEARANAVVLSSASGSYYVDGLPFTVGGTGYNSGSVSLYKVNFDDNTYVEVNASGTTVYFLVSRDNTTWTTLDQSVFGSQHYWHFTIMYTV